MIEELDAIKEKIEKSPEFHENLKSLIGDKTPVKNLKN